MADDELPRALCTFAGRRNPMSQRRMRKTTWAARTLPSAGGDQKYMAACPLIKEEKNGSWLCKRLITDHRVSSSLCISSYREQDF